ncbi:uncharacterized protein BDR25DRAFT_305753 [Lindgomyces ingoldianus]|uniref:Uncharacterized protein n=1 Tax=Lindgomyces ingoldianus TaxID=673940 RepID=A0ACB6QIU9_9PLEO|nr:uncharacterized protein BDR25DRAFT_305753 [Lindgomyces ingoldianus]KAF2466863.1 hypothetical protein BDR25DRAFT_305753 [Lindgomyces ingoldianus]
MPLGRMGSKGTNSPTCLAYSFLFASIIVQLTLATNDTRPCYNATGGVAPDHHPCVSSETKEISHCCTTWDTCLGDTLCLSQWGTLYVGTCTVKSWDSGRGDCPKYCANWNEENLLPDIGVCNWTDGSNQFCCGVTAVGINKCCEKTFTIQNATNQYVVQRPWNENAVNTSSTPSSTTSTPTSTCTAPLSEKGGDNKGAEIGLGVGLGIPLLIALGMLYWERRKRRQIETKMLQLNPTTQDHEYVGVPQAPLSGEMYQDAYPHSGSVMSELPSVSGPKPVHELGNDAQDNR